MIFFVFRLFSVLLHTTCSLMTANGSSSEVSRFTGSLVSRTSGNLFVAPLQQLARLLASGGPLASLRSVLEVCAIVFRIFSVESLMIGFFYIRQSKSSTESA